MQYRAKPALYEDFIDYYAYLGISPRTSDAAVDTSIAKAKSRYVGKNYQGHPRIKAVQSANADKCWKCQMILGDPVSRKAYDRVWKEHHDDICPPMLAVGTSSEVAQRYHEARRLFDQEDYRRAIMYLDDAERLDAVHNPTIPYMIGMCYQGMADEDDWPAGYAAAQRSLQYARMPGRQYVNHEEARAWALMAFFSEGNQQQRQYCYQQAANLDPDNPQYAVAAIHAMTDYGQALQLLEALRTKYPNAQCVRNEYRYMIFRYILTAGPYDDDVEEPSFPPRPSKEQVMLARSYYPLLDELGDGAALQETDDTVVFHKAPTVDGDIEEMRQIVDPIYARMTKPSLLGMLRSKFGH